MTKMLLVPLEGLARFEVKQIKAALVEVIRTQRIYRRAVKMAYAALDTDAGLAKWLKARGLTEINLKCPPIVRAETYPTTRYLQELPQQERMEHPFISASYEVFREHPRRPVLMFGSLGALERKIGHRYPHLLWDRYRRRIKYTCLTRRQEVADIQQFMERMNNKPFGKFFCASYKSFRQDVRDADPMSSWRGAYSVWIDGKLREGLTRAQLETVNELGRQLDVVS